MWCFLFEQKFILVVRQKDRNQTKKTLKDQQVISSWQKKWFNKQNKKSKITPNSQNNKLHIQIWPDFRAKLFWCLWWCFIILTFHSKKNHKYVYKKKKVWMLFCLNTACMYKNEFSSFIFKTCQFTWILFKGERRNTIVQTQIRKRDTNRKNRISRIPTYPLGKVYLGCISF